MLDIFTLFWIIKCKCDGRMKYIFFNVLLIKRIGTKQLLVMRLYNYFMLESVYLKSYQ